MAACETQPPKYIHFRSSNGYIQLNLGISSSQGDRKTVRDIKSSTCWKITEKKKQIYAEKVVAFDFSINTHHLQTSTLFWSNLLLTIFFSFCVH